VEKTLGKPVWSGTPEEAIVEENRENELWYEYDGAEEFQGRTTVVMNSKGVVTAVLVYPQKLFLDRALRLLGSNYLRREGKMGPCPTEAELRQSKVSTVSDFPYFLVYPEQGMYISVEEDNTILEIGYLLRCP
jgi:hypothetical protein